MRRLALALCVAGGWAGAPARAACPGETQTDMNLCAGQAWQAEDGKLNQAYQAVLARLGTDAGGRQRLTAVERAWIAFRDAQCAFVSSGSDGGSVAPMIAAQCKAEQTRLRTAALDELLHCAEGDLSCPVPAAP